MQQSPLCNPRAFFRSDLLNRKCFRAKRTPGFTLIELLTVIAIIGILAALMIVTVGKVRDRAATARCQSNLRQLGMAATLFAGDNKGRLPSIQNKDGQWWQEQISPHLNLPSTNAKKDVGRGDVFRCPVVADEDIATNFAGVPNYGYGPVKNFVTDFDTASNNYRGGKLLTEIKRPSGVWLFGDLGKPRTDDGTKPPTTGYETALSASRGDMWPGKAQPACRHGGAIRANFVAVDGHVESWSWSDFRSERNSVFGWDPVAKRPNF